MKKLYFVFFILFWTSLKIFSQNLNHVPLMVVLDSTQTIFGLNRVQIIISNLTDSTSVLLKGESQLFEVKMNDSTWIPIKSPMTLITHHSIRQQYSNRSKRDTIRYFVDLYSLYFNDSLSFQSIMNTGKQILFRYSIDIADPSFTNLKRIVSAPITLNIPPANQDDIAAFDYIMARKDTMMVLRYLSSDINNSTEESIPVYQYCIQHFPNSAIATMCALHYSKRLCQGYHEEQKTNQSNQLIIQANRSMIMSSNIPLLRSRARFSTRCAD
ncbi:MAG: hypothetical protein NW218_22130 [Saprospiraceae bacterium]|nr:hypothetical protein [Saprospiraceae bacterium]